jgi:hypothetical protein
MSKKGCALPNTDAATSVSGAGAERANYFLQAAGPSTLAESRSEGWIGPF